eukprot:TRINITY_DN50146_c0_g1_i1.p1 TRINITY_DN50146_c0_g1~~TRINITY_DN50146_c0_g1_i1.p1  ORF type:complete len:424 (+),score=52.29 TRINITY_DN50146_c0_g1_i1:129-1400(+)
MALDEKKARAAVMKVFEFNKGRMVSILIHLGDRLDLFNTLGYEYMGRFVTTDELAGSTKYARRWLMEWLRGMAAAQVLDYQEGTDETEGFRLSQEWTQVLANEKDSLIFSAGDFTGLVPNELSDGLVHAFRTGIGMSYRAMSIVTGGVQAVTTKRMLAAWTKLKLCQEILPVLAGGNLVDMVLKRKGIRILDMGCGAGVGAIAMGQAFPNAQVHGVDPDESALEIARADAAAAGVSNVEFSAEKGEDIDRQEYYDFACCLDIVHDCPFPDKILRAICTALKPGGTLLIKDIRSTGSFPEDLRTLPSLPLLYGYSVTACLSSATSEPGGMGLGTVGFSPPVAERMVREAGFGHFLQHNFRDPVNLYYECQKVGKEQSLSKLRPAATCAIDLSGSPGPLSCACGQLGYHASFNPKYRPASGSARL